MFTLPPSLYFYFETFSFTSLCYLSFYTVISSFTLFHLFVLQKPPYFTFTRTFFHSCFVFFFISSFLNIFSFIFSSHRSYRFPSSSVSYHSYFDNLLLCIYDMLYLLTAIGLSPGGSSTVHIYTQTIHRTIQNKQYREQHNNWKSAGRARSWLVIPWHLPYNRGNSTEKPQSG